MSDAYSGLSNSAAKVMALVNSKDLAPAAELGSLGDIYINTTEGKHAPYGQYPNEWKEWCGMHAGTIDTSPIPHPDTPSQVLGIMVNSGSIGWFSKGKAPGDTPYHSDNLHADHSNQNLLYQTLQT